MWKRWVILGAVMVTAAGSIPVWWRFGWFSSGAAVAEVQQLQEQMADPALKEADRQVDCANKSAAR